ncbi:alkyl hydroperoxide reductase subunit C [Arsenophonus sp.]|uniref:alkyl hydroperoxide reductase subunit C n=1 Tax=Arsenophonus sp. TaxID=1872640 RepID=UPI0028635E45|nr:alkyl hydroperoxide reductase subunit C [Arsenophonus sp.]MDR5611735.1 alkyl hydroperoxide reductase subunit C [Arsenophonus sp.]MDR5617783.1 alkyl hydroperoxide reductase subunit C [Arsenophonus sp.]
MSLVNTEIKPFQNTAFKDGKFIDISEKDIKGKWSIFFFYPADFTFVCPTELGDLADHYEEFQKLGVEIYSVSTDTHFTHKEWHSHSDTIGKIKYTMIGDPSWTLTRNFEVMRKYQENDEQKELGLADRGTFIVDPKGIIQAVEITAEGIGRDASDLLRKIKAAQYVASHPGEVCPAKWKEGEATLSPSLDLVGKI